MSPLVSVITPTWQRHEVLLGRCVPSVQAQVFRDFEHLIVSDGPDPELAQVDLPPNVRLVQLDDHDPFFRWGYKARLRGIEEAAGEIIAWLDDDDAWRPRHLTALTRPAMAIGGFAYSRCIVHAGGREFRIGDGPPAHGRIVPASMMVHDRQILNLETWNDKTDWPDWDLVSRWLDRGVPFTSVDEVTVDYYPAGVDFSGDRVPVAFTPHRPLVPPPWVGRSRTEGRGTWAQATVLRCPNCGHAMEIEPG